MPDIRTDDKHWTHASPLWHKSPLLLSIDFTAPTQSESGLLQRLLPVLQRQYVMYFLSGFVHAPSLEAVTGRRNEDRINDDRTAASWGVAGTRHYHLKCDISGRSSLPVSEFEISTLHADLFDKIFIQYAGGVPGDPKSGRYCSYNLFALFFAFWLFKMFI